MITHAATRARSIAGIDTGMIKDMTAVAVLKEGAKVVDRRPDRREGHGILAVTVRVRR